VQTVGAELLQADGRTDRSDGTNSRFSPKTCLSACRIWSLKIGVWENSVFDSAALCDWRSASLRRLQGSSNPISISNIKQSGNNCSWTAGHLKMRAVLTFEMFGTTRVTTQGHTTEYLNSVIWVFLQRHANEQIKREPSRWKSLEN